MSDASVPGATALPVGTVTFLRTDIEGSMGLVRALGPRWDAVNDRHLGLIRAAIDEAGGTVVRTEGDAVFAVFPEAVAAVSATVDAQRALAGEAWPDGAGIRVRMGLHTGEAHRSGADYGGFDVNRAARVAAVGHGGQIVLSETTAALVADALPPGTALRDLGRHAIRDVPRPERLHQLDIAGLPTEFPPLRTAAAATGNLPDRLTSFLGRDRELAELVDRLRDGRLVTLTGAGGIGKTSLAIEVARVLADEVPDGGWFVGLATLGDPGEVRAAVAHAIGVLDGPERSAATALHGFLADRSMILVLDNMEHLLDAADEVGAIVRASPRSRVIVTSRAPLRIAGEQEVPVAPLSDDAVALFTERARAVRPGWEPGTDAPAVEEICRLLDDLPLGIELAAARVATLPPAVIRDRLAAHLPLPGSGPRDAPSRQRTLDSTVAWSYDLLTPERQQLFRSLGVFDGGFDADEVAAVAGPGPAGTDRLDDLMELADQSLIVAVPGSGGRARFRMLRTIQSYALDRLAADGTETDARRRQAEAFLALLVSAAPDLYTSRHAAWLSRIDPERANLRAAMRWTIEAGEADLALRLAASLWRFWHAFGQVAEGRALTEQALAMPSAPRSGSVRAWAVSAAGSLAYWQGDHDAARRHYEDQVALATAAADEAGVADAWFNLGHVAFVSGEDVQSRMHILDQTIARYRDLGDERGAARASWGRGIVAMSAGNLEGAAAFLEHDLEVFERLDDRQYHAMTGASLAWAAFAFGDIRRAVQLAVDALVETRDMLDLGTTTISLHVGVLIGALIGHFDEAAMLHGAFDALCDRYGVRPPAALETFVGGQDPFRLTREGMESGPFSAAYERGRRMTLDEAVDLVVELGEVAGRELDDRGTMPA
jgi:predicted ATPase/class 3 adenylate cyclase